MASLMDLLFEDKDSRMSGDRDDSSRKLLISESQQMTQADETAGKMAPDAEEKRDMTIPDAKTEKKDTSGESESEEMIPDEKGADAKDRNPDETSSTDEVGEKVQDVVEDDDLLPGSELMKESEKEGSFSVFSVNSAKQEKDGDVPIKLNRNVKFDDAQIDEKVLEKGLTEKVNLLLQTRESAGKDYDMNRDIEKETDTTKKETPVVKKLVRDSMQPVEEVASESLSKGESKSVRDMQRIAKELDETLNDVIVEKIQRQHDEDGKRDETKVEDSDNINPYYRLKENRLPGNISEVLDREETHTNENTMRLAVDFKIKTDVQSLADSV